MAKNKETIFVCNNCGNEFSKWVGQCSGCGEWNSLKEIKSLGKPIKGLTSLRSRQTEVKNLSKMETKSDNFSNVFSSSIILPTILCFKLVLPFIGNTLLFIYFFKDEIKNLLF